MYPNAVNINKINANILHFSIRYVIIIYAKRSNKMLQKSKLKKGINASRKKIALLEQKRTRSQAALVYALLNHTTPADSDIEYFNQFTVQIENERAHMHELMAELEKLV